MIRTVVLYAAKNKPIRVPSHLVLWIPHTLSRKSQREKIYFRTCSLSEDSDQNVHPRSLISHDSLCHVHYPNRAQWRLIRLNECADWFDSSMSAQVSGYSFSRCPSSKDSSIHTNISFYEKWLLHATDYFMNENIKKRKAIFAVQSIMLPVRI